ncbi:RluA family pseudouridine synthase [Shewanella gaetbuli]|uniref:RluA family pseudouridine synthase n=1 Tax=Shewanella gaetbuli TaxID=220752 RepID=A0A9X1ZQ12_9GAMM|nr:RluA family pseudouridine synthase [Shewanella gaetbuli]MCL1141958.1 RluA family pseudouridine synthase [Shewanella gaetbuli]
MSEFIAPPCAEQISILYQDEHLLLINKPSGLLSLSGKNPQNFDSVHYRLVQQFPNCTLVHRLDFGTSGIMLVALNKHINGLLTKQFQSGLVEKTYTAILQHELVESTGDITLPIAKAEFPLMQVCHHTGKPSHSRYQLVEVVKDADGNLSSRVIFTPITGRTHQLRLHSQQIGHPILGCDLYSMGESAKLAPRLLLHATTLTFTHPISAEKIHWQCECPF